MQGDIEAGLIQGGTYNPLAGQNQSLRNLQIESGSQPAILAQGQNQSADIGNQILDLLRQYQKYGRSQELAGQQEQIQRTFQTPSELIGAAPSVQAGERSARVEAVEPTIGGARSLVEEAKNLLTEYQQTEEKNVNRAQNIIEAAVSSGAAGLEELIRTNPALFKKAGYDTKSFEAVLKGLKAKEAKEKSTESDKQIAEVKSIETRLIQSKRGGEFVDGNVYLQERARSRMGPSEFDGRFGQLLSPSDKSKYGVGGATINKASRLQELLLKSSNGENLDALTLAEQAELYSLL